VPTLSDEQLMEHYLEGSHRAFEALYRRHLRGLVRFFERRGLEGAEFSQHTFFRVVCARDQYQRRLPFKPWLMAIAKNLVRDARRRQSTANQSRPLLTITEPADQPMNRVDAKLVVSHALAAISDVTRRVVARHHAEGVSFSELSALEGVSVTALKVRAHRAYGAMRHACRSPPPFVVAPGGSVKTRGTGT
jgi:RNA polymerase sigma factor (sigma-70 family)